MPTESVYISKENWLKLRKAAEKTGESLPRLINLLVEEGHLEEVVARRGVGSLRSAHHT